MKEMKERSRADNDPYNNKIKNNNHHCNNNNNNNHSNVFEMMVNSI